MQRARVGLHICVPSLKTNIFPYGFALLGELLRWCMFKKTIVGQFVQPVQCRPAQQAGVSVVLALIPWLPNAIIGPAPIRGDEFADPCENALSNAIKSAAVKRKLRGGVHDLAIDIELQLAPGLIPDSYRARPKIALQVRQFALLWRILAKNRVDDS